MLPNEIASKLNDFYRAVLIIGLLMTLADGRCLWNNSQTW